MKRKEFYILAALAIISGLVGGLLSGKLTSSTAFAQANRVLEVETLRIMDKDGVPRISLTATNEGPRIVFIGKDGQVQSFLGVRSDGSVALTLAANSGKTNADSEINHNRTTKSDATVSPAIKPALSTVGSKKNTSVGVTVYATRSGSKYHSAGCSYLRKSRIPMSLSAAKGKYSPCSRCSPPR